MAELFELKQEDLHLYWDAIIQRGALDIKRDMKPSWRVEDIYSLLRNQQVTCALLRSTHGPHAGRLLAYIIFNKQFRLFSYEPECFIWLAWNLPMREWDPQDNMPAVVRQGWDHVAKVAKEQYLTDQITWITRPSRAKAFMRKFGWQPAWVTMTVKV